MKSIISTFLILSIFQANLLVGQENSNTLVKDLKVEAQRITDLMEWDSSFTEQLNSALLELERENEDKATSKLVTERLLTHYKAIQKTNKSRVKQQFEENTIAWLFPLSQHLINPEANTSKIISGFPDTYFATKLLAPELLTDSALTIIADKYPKEVLHNIRYMVNGKAKFEVELAALNAPYEAKQYLHYSNNINSILKTSTNENILKLYEIYDKYRYGSKSFYLLDKVVKGEMSIDRADEVSKERESLYNALVDIYKDTSSLGRYSAEEMLSELSDKYSRKLIFQRHLSSSSLNLEAIKALSYDAKIYFLFSSQNLLKKKDLQNLTKLYIAERVNPIDESILDWIPVDWINTLNERIAKEKLNTAMAPLIQPSLWVELRKRALPQKEIIKPVIFENTTEVEETVKFVFKPYIINLSQADKEVVKLENNPHELLEDLSKVTGKLYSRKVLIDLAEQHPVEVMAQIDKFKNEPYAADVCQALAKAAPLTVKNYLIKSNHKIHPYLKAKKDTAISTLYHINDTLGNWTRAYILLDKIVNKELSYQEANVICKDKSLLIPQLIDIYIKPNYLGWYTVEKELEYNALDFIRNFNISENTDREFSANLLTLDAKTIYTYLVLGEQEIINKTFNKMYRQLATATNNDFTSLFETMNYKYVDRFVRMAVHYGKEYDFFNHVKNTDKLLGVIYKELENDNRNKVSASIEAADIIVGMNDKNRIHAIHEIIRSEYERLEIKQDDKGVATYGILAAILSQRQREQWANAAADHFRIPNLTSIPVHSLFNEDLINIQQYYFYNDRDGIYSYRNFIKQYESSNYNWKIDDKGSFVKITSKSGKSVAIYANKPTEGEDGITTLENYLRQNNLNPQILVHRGLSTHTLKTFNRVPASTKLILDGSCGGFHIQSVALENAPGAQILCNRNIGTMYINDPMFKQISESIRQGKDLVWPSFWSEMEARLGTNQYFKDYIPPHKNVAALIIRAYYDVLDIN